MKILALDIGGTAVKYGVFGGDSTFGQFSVADDDGRERLPEKIIACVAQNETECIGISTPGPFDFETGTGLMTHKLKSLYRISLKEMIERQFPKRKLLFVHDSTSFIFGALYHEPALIRENIAGVMLGTGLGYVHCVNGRAEVNCNKTPLNPLWNQPYRNGIAENYVSATAILRKAYEKGNAFQNVKAIADAARAGDRTLLAIFTETGAQLGELLERQKKEDGFQRVIIGGQVSGAWDLMVSGFRQTSALDCHTVADPSTVPLYGIKYCAENGAEHLYI